MVISIRLATTGEVLFTEAYDPLDDLRVWELRMRFCRAVKNTAFFAWIFFHEQVLVDDAAFVSAYMEDPHAAESIVFHAIVRQLRPPTEEEEIAIGDCLQLRHRSHLWNLMSQGIAMTSLLPRGTAWEATLVRAIKADYPPTYDAGPLPDSLTTLLLAECDPNVIGSPSLSPLGAAIRRGEDRSVEVLLQHRADPQLREDSRDLPLLIAIPRGSTECVKILLNYRADPYAVMSAPAPGPHGIKPIHTRHTTAMELAASSPAIVTLLRTAMEGVNSTAEHTRQGY